MNYPEDLGCWATFTLAFAMERRIWGRVTFLPRTGLPYVVFAVCSPREDCRCHKHPAVAGFHFDRPAPSWAAGGALRELLVDLVDLVAVAGKGWPG